MSSILSLLVVYCSSLEENLAFYKNLGLDFIREKHGDGPVHYSCTLGLTVVELYPSSEKNPVSNCRLGFKIALPTVESQDRKTLIDPDGRTVDLAYF